MSPDEFDKMTGIPSFRSDCGTSTPIVPDGFDLADVTEVVWSASFGLDDGGTYVAVLMTEPGKFYVVDAWCDTTGWGCQDGTTVRGPMDARNAFHPVTLDRRGREEAWPTYRAACVRFNLDDPGVEAPGPEDQP